MPIVQARFQKMAEGSNAVQPVCTADQALEDLGLQKHFLYQRAQINGYYKQAKKVGRSNYGDIQHHINSLVTPLLFSVNNATPTNSRGEFMENMARGNR